MTLILTVNGPETIWLLADRRLSYAARAPRDDARKVVSLETTDGAAILGYAGLGATVLGTEPSDWISAVLRGRNLPLEQCLEALLEALRKEFPRHLLKIPGADGPAQYTLIPAFVNDEPRLYTIDLVFEPGRKHYIYRCTRHVGHTPVGTPKTPRIGLAGSGGFFLNRSNKRWIRNLLKVSNACDRGRLTPLAVADHLAQINYAVHQGISDKSVGPRCIVVWRHKKSGTHKGGGGHQFYTGTDRDRDSPYIPTIANGIDLAGIIQVSTRHILPILVAAMNGQTISEPDKDQINSDLARLPDKPDERLK